MRTTDTSRQLISLSDAADQLGVCTRTVRRHIAAGRLRGYRVGTQIIRVDAGELEQLLHPIPAAQ
jgi:excisionase family DNA binding protein